MQKLEITEVVRFLDTLYAFQKVKRKVRVHGEERYENDIEHSYQLAMAVWHAIETFNLPLDKDKAIRYALAHDLPEIHAGDTWAYAAHTESGESKKEREAVARKQLATDFPTVPSMHEAMEQYEEQTDPESVFVRAFDKILPLISNYLQDGRTFKENGLCFSQVEELKLRTTKQCPEVQDLAQQILELFNKDRAHYFGANIH